MTMTVEDCTSLATADAESVAHAVCIYSSDDAPIDDALARPWLGAWSAPRGLCLPFPLSPGAFRRHMWFVARSTQSGEPGRN